MKLTRPDIDAIEAVDKLVGRDADPIRGGAKRPSSPVSLLVAYIRELEDVFEGLVLNSPNAAGSSIYARVHPMASLAVGRTMGTMNSGMDEIELHREVEVIIKDFTNSIVALVDEQKVD